MPPNSSRTPQDGDTRTRAALIVAVLVFVGGFVLTMTFMGISPTEAVGVALLVGTATGTITRVLLDLLGPSRTDKPVPPEPPTGGPGEIPAEPKPEEIIPVPTEEASS